VRSPDIDPILHELTPVAEQLLDRHLGVAREWFPHELVPWSRGRDFVAGEQWDPAAAPLPPAVRSALVVNLLTEDNLPYYFRTIEQTFGADGAWGEWVRRWTAEEGRHAIVIRDYLTVTRAVDPVALERGRMRQVAQGIIPEPDSPTDAMVYVALQELATRLSHRATGKELDDAVGYRLMARVAADENLHFLFYRDLVGAALQVDPSAVVLAIERQVRNFQMPGTGISDFADHALAIAKAGIYDLRAHHEQVLVPLVLRDWRVADLDGLSDEAEQARQALVSRIDRVGRAGRRMADRWALRAGSPSGRRGLARTSG
jgi:acyl-[acyl-carrier-protein] desaturase